MQQIEANVSRQRVPSLVAYAVATAALWLAPSVASASTNYPDALKASETYANFTADCLLCHATLAGGIATTPFAVHLKQNFGLVGGGNSAALISAFDQAAAAKLDLDEDGALDIDEVLGGGNPNDKNVGVGGTAPRVQAEYGCLGTIAGNKSSTDGAALTAAALVAAVLVLKRRR